MGLWCFLVWTRPCIDATLLVGNYTIQIPASFGIVELMCVLGTSTEVSNGIPVPIGVLFRRVESILCEYLHCLSMLTRGCVCLSRFKR